MSLKSASLMVRWAGIAVPGSPFITIDLAIAGASRTAVRFAGSGTKKVCTGPSPSASTSWQIRHCWLYRPCPRDGLACGRVSGTGCVALVLLAGAVEVVLAAEVVVDGGMVEFGLGAVVGAVVVVVG